MTIKATVIADSINTRGERITTFELEYPRFIHREVMTHRVFSRNRASCLTADTLITIEKPSNVHNGKPRSSSKMRLGDIVNKWVNGDSHGRNMQDRIKKMHLRCLNEDTEQYETTNISNVFLQGEQPVYKITLENGYTLTCTKKHRIYTNSGWRTLEDFNIIHRKNNTIAWDNNIPSIATNGFSITEEWLVEEKLKGKSITQISNENNLNFKSVSYYAEKYGIRFRKPLLQNETFEYKDKDWLQSKISEGLFSTEIAELCNSTSDRVKKTMKKYGITGNKRHICKGDIPWNKGKRYKVSEETSIKMKKIAQALVKHGTYNYYKDTRAAMTRFLTENRISIYEKHNYACAISGSTRDLQLHHIDPIWHNKERRFDASNLIPLNKHVHKFIHKNNLDLLFLDYVNSNKDISNFLVEHQDYSLLASDICKPRGTGNALVAKYSKISKIEYMGIQETYDLEVSGPYHNFVANNIVVHNSRAIPVDRLMDLIKEDTAMPVHWGKNQPGMSAKEECDTRIGKSDTADGYSRTEWWNKARDAALSYAKLFNEAGYHKQIVNRITEPFTHIKVVCTATEYDNFFWLRKHKDAQPEIQRLAEVMFERREASEPKLLNVGSWHVPYYGTESIWVPVFDETNDTIVDISALVDINGFTLEDALSISSSCAAQISYRRLDSSVEKGRDIYKRLIESFPPHFSPFEHQASPLPILEDGVWALGTTHIDANGNYWSGNFRGWTQHRQLLMVDLNMEYMTSKYKGAN